ncbi:porin [Burkholderia gladioli]|jgi:predicted porin|uniref:Gram-negative porin family protein n=1 Tax=Burkholderia gladioli TaxID=28095 RepID=A0AAW3F9T7_BURGA|nr:porin [Burkholderia gladioli]AJW98933.1 gram-negative porin family protein [Burkholderia gladioli]ASD77979.1 porin [Burkholderia gladioli pv. gladioli]AWY53110.1 porin [Burkholderia gladioli pv. gladioli]KGC17076.1 gram-negative porin family protein [Burkholderia gladioli]MBU9644537.1 porin [Burkholderia gladioli]
MKKSLLALVALSAFAGAAHAQSSVTLYGIIDAGILFNNNANGARQWQQSSGVLQGSRWGLKGAEDLGGGLKAIFVLENGFSISNGSLGQGGAMFGRQAYVGLSSDSLGKVTLGRQYDSVVDYTGALATGSQWAGYIGAHPGDLDNMNNANRVNNAVKYTSPVYGGFQFGGLYSLGGVAGQPGRNQIFSVGAGYNNGPLALGVGYVNARNPNYSFFGNNPNANTATSTSGLNMTSPVYRGYASANTLEIVAAAGAYSIGAATLGVTYSYTRFDAVGSTGGTGLNPLNLRGDAVFNNVEANFKYQLTPALLAGIAYDYTRGSKVNGQSAAQYHQVNLGVDYFLSKRTDLYAIGVYQHALGYDSTGNRAVASINNITASATPNQVAAQVGIRHKF